MTVIADKLATQVVQKAVENSQVQNQPQQNSTSAFADMMQEMGGGMGFADMLGMTDNQLLPNGQAQAISAESIPFDMSQNEVSQVEPAGGQKITEMLSDFNQQQMHMDNLVNEVLYGGKKFSNQELLAIQAHVFHVGQMTELTVKTVELAVSSFKGVMNTQIQ
ncbi:MAG: hypothetical protein Q8P84_04490 [Deltaproteobacteria bacterium]|nr:hypothetical protein [Deltaproteobacteria bacterium]MDZ4224676.1 hypothetical protein [bacterium]